MLQAKSLRRLIERFIVIWKVLFAWLKSIVRRTTMVPTPAPAAQLPRERFYGGEQKRARHRPVRCDEEAFVQVDRDEARSGAGSAAISRAVHIQKSWRDRHVLQTGGVS
jgi:hypothetical protein